MSVVYAGDRVARFHEKRSTWYAWLGAWGYSTVDVFRALHRLRPSAAHVAWLRTECERGFLTHSKGFLGYPRISVYSATPLAAAHGLLGTGEALAPSDRSRALSRPSAAHDLAVQHYLAGRAGARPCESLEIQGIQHQPDAITEDRACFEIELTQKAEDRIFRIYLFYAHAIGAGMLGPVTFVFRDAAIADAYRRRFDATEWPDAVYSPAQRRYLSREPFSVGSDHPVRGHFSFITQPALWPFA